RNLADMAVAVLRQLALTEAPVYPTGGVFRVGDLILQPFSEALARLAPQAFVAQPALPPLGGALVMALELAGALSAEATANVAISMAAGGVTG
ncbi:MAG: ATPase BadF/BadG/BcrA/BcrD type, partial [Firmicutes bacterium]|nr:ATPase BadF/BadG/BcrA/BcrD type [Bacillota bacterium]